MRGPPGWWSWWWGHGGDRLGQQGRPPVDPGGAEGRQHDHAPAGLVGGARAGGLVEDGDARALDQPASVAGSTSSRIEPSAIPSVHASRTWARRGAKTSATDSANGERTAIRAIERTCDTSDQSATAITAARRDAGGRTPRSEVVGMRRRSGGPGGDELADHRSSRDGKCP